MDTLENVYQVAFIILSSVGGAGAIIAALSSWLGKVWANRILESDKAKYAQELDKIRHQFHVEFDQLSIIHENQKTSFQRMIKELRKSVLSLRQEYDEPWRPLKDSTYDALKEVVIEESLFLGAEGEKALNIYLDFLGRAVYFPEDPPPDDKMLRDLYEFLDFMSERIREYFRKRIGLSDEAKPLFDVHLIAACLLVSEYQFGDTDSQIQSSLKFQFEYSPSALVDNLKGNLAILRSALIRLVSSLESEGEKKKYRSHALAEARYYLKVLGETSMTAL